MTEEKKCYHFNNTKDEATDTLYCKDCNVILLEEKYWRGEITIGKFETTYETTEKVLNFTKLISEHINGRIVIKEVSAIEGKWSWGNDLAVIFSLVGSSESLIANISFTRMTRHLPTGEFFVAPETLTSEDQISYTCS